IGDSFDEIVRHVEFRHDRADSALHRGPEGVVDVHEHGALWRRAGGLEYFLLVCEGIAQDHARCWKVAKYELVALLGDLRRRSNIDDVGNTLLLGDLRDRRALAGIEGANQDLRTLADQFLGPRAGDIDVGFGIAIHDLEGRHAEILEDTGCNIDAALAVLADAGLETRAREQHADFQGSALRAHNVKRGRAGEGDGAERRCDSASRKVFVIIVRFAGHADALLPGCNGYWRMMPDFRSIQQARTAASLCRK